MRKHITLRMVLRFLRNWFQDAPEAAHIRTRRRVAKDRTIVLNGRLYEAPVPLIGKQVLLLYHENQPERVEALDGNQSYGFLIPVDLHINARVRRNKESGTELQTSRDVPRYQGGKLWSPKREER